MHGVCGLRHEVQALWEGASVSGPQTIALVGAILLAGAMAARDFNEAIVGLVALVALGLLIAAPIWALS